MLAANKPDIKPDMKITTAVNRSITSPIYNKPFSPGL